MAKKYMIYGAKSIALGVCLAMREVHPFDEVVGFVVSSLDNNPSELAGLPVRVLDASVDKETHILIATPENMQAEIALYLEKNGFYYYTCMDSLKVASLMEEYYVKTGRYQTLHKYLENDEIVAQDEAEKEANIQVYMAKFYKDRELKNSYQKPEWVVPLQVGAALTEERVAQLCDDTGENISEKNVNYSELTALYWMWKNRCQNTEFVESVDYIGLFHYRRILDITKEEMKQLCTKQVDVILPFPMISEPDITEHHARYIKEEDWEAMLQALEELQPEYAKAYADIFSGNCMYNYNIMIARSTVLAEYCAWLFPILKRTEELSNPKGWERSDRYIGYLGENLATLYFMYHRKDLKIVHTGCFMLV